MYKFLKLAFISLLMLCFSACREEDPIMPPEQQTAEKPYSYSCHTAQTSTAFCSEILRT